MASLTSIREGIGTNLGNITSLIVYNHVPDFIEPPTAVVGVVDIIEFDISMKSERIVHNFLVGDIDHHDWEFNNFLAF